MILYGIDPGVKTGLAIWNTEKKHFEAIKTTTIVEAAHTVLKDKREKKLYIEDARLRKWFNDAKVGRSAKLQGVGSIKRDCSVWEHFCVYYGVNFEMVHPKNNMTKLKSAEFAKMTGWRERTSEHGRDAGMLVFGR